MARKVFFSFHYERDSWRVAQVRNSNVVSSSYDRSTFLDHADWQSIERSGENAIKKWIDGQLEGSTITCVLIGNQTNTRKWVDYEIEKSIERKNAVLGIYINNIKNQYSLTDSQGINPLTKFRIGWNSLSYIAPTYDWVFNYGYQNFSHWIEEAVNKFKSIKHFRGT